MRLGHLRALDGLRGIAILGVIGMHLFGYPTGGFYGVDLFFVLSGFLITTLLLEERDKAGEVSLRGFYRRRAYRLLPALLTALAAWVIVTRASPRGPRAGRRRRLLRREHHLCVWVTAPRRYASGRVLVAGSRRSSSIFSGR